MSGINSIHSVEKECGCSVDMSVALLSPVGKVYVLGDIFTFGDNRNGQLGIGRFTVRDSVVKTDFNFVDIR